MAGTHTTPDGAHYNWLTNKTGAASVKGTLVQPSSSTDFAFSLSDADSIDPFGVVFDDGVPDGGECRVIFAGKAQVLLEDTTAATRGYWVRSSENDTGRADATNAAPPGGTVQALEQHYCEIGHCLESVAAGSDKLCWVLLHFN